MNADVLHIEADSAEVQHLTAVGTIGGVVPLLAAARNGPGIGLLQSSGDGTFLSWRAPQSDTFGEPVECSPDGTFVLADGDDPDKWLRIEVHGAYLVTGSQTEVFLTDRYNNDLGQADLSAAEAAAGDVLDYALTLRNTHTETLSDIRVWTAAAADARTEVSWDGVTYAAPHTEETGILLASLAAAATATLYVRRTVPAGQSSDPKQLVHLHVAYDAPGEDRRFIEARGLYRIFNAAEFRFYRSQIGPPAEGSFPFATNGTLPFTPADTFADGTWYLSVSYFNGVLDSGFLPLGPAGETFLLLTISGGQSGGQAPAGPLDWRLELAAGGVVRIVAAYYEEGDSRASQWSIAYTSDGSDPPADDADLTEDLPIGGLAVLSYQLPAAADGVLVKVRLQARRNDGTDELPVWVYSADSTIKSIVADAAAPSAPIAADRWPGQLPIDE